MFKQFKRAIAFVVFVFVSMLIGSVLGKIAGLSLKSGVLYSYISQGKNFTLPLVLDLKVLLINMEVQLVINALGVIGAILGGILFFRLRLW